MNRKWMSLVKGILGGVITYIMVTLVLDAFSEEIGDTTAGTLLETIIPLIVVFMIIFQSFRGMEGGQGGRLAGLGR